MRTIYYLLLVSLGILISIPMTIIIIAYQQANSDIIKIYEFLKLNQTKK